MNARLPIGVLRSAVHNSTRWLAGLGNTRTAEVARTCLGQFAYWTAGKLSRVKTYQRYYEIYGTPEDTLKGKKIVITRAGRMWMPCRLSDRLLVASTRIDPVHWDHWALEHKGCGASYCMDCRGYRCGNGLHDLDSD